MWTDDEIIFLKDVSAPSATAAKKGDVRKVNRNIDLYYARLAVKSGLARQVKNDEQIENTLIELGLKEKEAKNERKERNVTGRRNTQTRSKRAGEY